MKVFSRNQEDNTNKYPDIVRRMQAMMSELQQSVTSAVIDSEAVAWDRQQNSILPFQELSKRKRKVLVMSSSSDVHFVVFHSSWYSTLQLLRLCITNSK